MRKLVTLAVLACLLPAAAAAQEYATTKEAEMMVHQAVSFLKKEGKEKAFEVFNDPKGRFTYRDLYIMVYDMSGNCVSHGAKKDRIGKNFMDEKDADGKQFVKERIQIARDHGKGWQEYKFQNPLTKQIEQKVSYFERVGDVVVCCGAYKKR